MRPGVVVVQKSATESSKVRHGPGFGGGVGRNARYPLTPPLAALPAALVARGGRGFRAAFSQTLLGENRNL